MRDVGLRLRHLREERFLTQDELARKVELSPEFISSIERGTRSPSLESLIKLSEYFNVDTSFFLDEEKDAFSLLEAEQPKNKIFQKEIRIFKKGCEDYLKVEDLSGRRLEPAPLYQPKSPKELALDERRRLGLGEEPIRDIFTLIEINGLRIFRQAVDPAVKIAGLFIHIASKNTSFAMINANQKLGLQVTAAAHLYAHYLKDRYDGPVIDNPDIFVDEYLSLYPQKEQSACLFAAHFLIPEQKIRSLIQKDQLGRELKYVQIIFLKRYFGVNTDMMLRHLNRLNILTYNNFMKFREIDTMKFEQSLFGDSAGPEEYETSIEGKVKSSDRYKSLAVSVMQTGPKKA